MEILLNASEIPAAHPFRRYEKKRRGKLQLYCMDNWIKNIAMYLRTEKDKMNKEIGINRGNTNYQRMPEPSFLKQKKEEKQELDNKE